MPRKILHFILLLVPTLSLAQGVVLQPERTNESSYAPVTYSRPAVALPLSAPGCYPNGANLGSKVGTVTRATTQTMVTGAPFIQNLVPWSEQIDNATWSKTNLTVAPDVAVAPDGHFDADRLNDDGTNGIHVAQSISITTVAGPYTMSMSVKAGTLSWVVLSLDGGGSIGSFNASTCALGTMGGTNTGTVTQQPNGWCFITMTKVQPAGSQQPRIFLGNANNSISYAGGTGNLFVADTQVAFGTVPSVPYVETGAVAVAQGPISSCANNALAVSTDGAEVWPAATNLALWSESVDNVAWSKVNATVTADVDLSPDGNPEADRVAVTAGGSQVVAYQAPAQSGAATRVSSVWIKAGSQGTTASIRAATDALTGTCLNVTPTSTWTRYFVADTATATATGLIAIYPHSNCALGTGTSGDNVLFYGAQYEVGAYPTPYVPTSGTATVRNATTATVPLPALHTTNRWCIGATAMPGPGQTWAQATLNRGILNGGGFGLANSFIIYTNSSQVIFNVTDNASALRTLTWGSGSLTGNTPHRFVACDNSGATALYIDGASVGSVSGAGSGLLSATPTLYVGGNAGEASAFTGTVRDVRLYPTGTYRPGM